MTGRLNHQRIAACDSVDALQRHSETVTNLIETNPDGSRWEPHPDYLLFENRFTTRDSLEGQQFWATVQADMDGRHQYNTILYDPFTRSTEFPPAERLNGDEIRQDEEHPEERYDENGEYDEDGEYDEYGDRL